MTESMWQQVRGELARLHWEVEPPLTLELHDEWTQTVAALQKVRRALGPVPADDPIALLASATAGADRANGGRQVLAPSLAGVRDALAELAGRVETGSDDERRRQAASLNLVAYELVHWVRVRTTSPQARDWLLAGESALDSALHTRGSRLAIAVGLGAWQDALAAVQPVRETAIVQRSLALGHLTILRATHGLIRDAANSGSVDRPYADALIDAVRDMARLHQATLSRLASRDLGSSRIDQAVMLKLGSATRHLTAPAEVTEPAHPRLDVLLRSGLGHTVLVAHLMGDPASRTIAARIDRLALDYRANPGILTAPETPGDGPTNAMEASRPTPIAQSRSEGPTSEVVATVARGAELTREQILDRCHARDLGVAAATSDPARPPDLLRGIHPERWPQLVQHGRQAVADLVTAVTPMVLAQAKGAWNGEDLRGHLFVELLRAATRFDPQRNDPEAWPAHAWTTLKYARMTGVDKAGVPNSRSPRPATVALDGWEPASHEPEPSHGIEQRQALQTIQKALGSLPDALREALVESMKGRSSRVIAENLGVSESTITRRLRAARERVRDQLGPPENQATPASFESVSSDADKSSSRLEERRMPTARRVRQGPAR